ncbi:MAG TPA: MFS transporter [Chthoniobacteraceae bacterium]|nr:MFS transporter [Chthoniobacteraceae bacterium]
MQTPPETSDTPEVPLASGLSAAEESACLAKIAWRLLPLLFFCYVIAYIDRINVGFAKLHLQDALAVDPSKFESAFGLGAGIFFIGYFLFEVPSNLILQRVGARIWIARIMIVWGIVSGAFMFLKGAPMFYIMRFLLGAAEAGFFPGVLLYFTYWYPARERAKIIALFAVGGVAAGVIGSPINGLILHTMDGVGGMKGWQWLFLVEALPAVLFGFVVLCVLPNRPGETKWLSAREKAWIEHRVSADPARALSTGHHSLKDAFTSRQVYLFCLIYFLLNIGSYGFEMWAPTIVKQLSQGSDKLVGWINAIPYFIAGVMMFVIGRSSDRTGERRLHIAFSAGSAAIGFAVAAFTKNPFVAMAGLVVAFAGLKCTVAPFWAATTAFLSGTAAAGGIAFINSVGNLGGYVGPHVVGVIKDKTSSNVVALVFLSGALFAMALLTLAIPKVKSSSAPDGTS